MYDELALDTVGDRKTALFLIMSDTDPTFNFLIAMIYTQLFNLLCEKADDVYGGRLPVHVRCLIDECANIGQIPNLEKLVATIRSREISACLVYQTKSQIKATYKDHADTIIGNMDTQVFLGGSEPSTLKDLSEALGKETIDIFNTCLPLSSVFELFLLLSVQNECAAIDHRSMFFRAWDSAQRAKCVNLSKFTLLASLCCAQNIKHQYGLVS